MQKCVVRRPPQNRIGGRMAGVTRRPGGEPRATQVAQDYLKAMWSCEEAGEDGISVNDLAARMGVVASTASENVARLASQGLVTHEPYRRVHFTDEGRALAIAMVRRHRLLETYLHVHLDFEWDEVHEEAEILEHAVTDRLLDHIDAALGHPNRDPHGDPIPDASGAVETRPMLPLADMVEGEWASVARLSDEDPQTLRDLDAAGLRLDARVRLVRRRGEGLVLDVEERTGIRISGSTARLVQVTPLDA